MFIGRKKEVGQLVSLQRQDRSSLVVIKGRRRIGKSRLAAECALGKRFLSFSGIAPVEGMSAQDQRNHFSRQLVEQLNVPFTTFIDWTDALVHLSHYLENEPTVILLDEISWMSDQDPTFIPKLKDWWDRLVLVRPKLMCILCGSVSIWIEKNILNSTAFFGRISLTITLEPLSIAESYQFLREKGFKGSAYECYQLLAITGGVPWYLEQIFTDSMAYDNIKRLCFEPNGLLVSEFDHIFYDLFYENKEIYKKILEHLKEGMRTLAEIRVLLGAMPSGSLSVFMENLIISGFVSKHPQWSLKTGALRKQSLYRIKDPYIRFYLKAIEPERSRIELGYYESSLGQMAEFDSMMGLQVESLLLSNRAELLAALSIKPIDCVFDNPYRQTQTVRHRGCQIDYLVQTKTRNLFLCEFKFKRSVLGSEVIDEMMEKSDRLSIPRGYAMVPVLFHLGEVSPSVYEKKYFYRIIDLADFLQME